LKAANLIASCDAVVFDCGETLLRLDPPRELIFRDAAAELQLDLPLANIARAYELVDFAVRMRSSELPSAEAKQEFYLAVNTKLCMALGVQQSLAQLHPLLMKHFAARRRWVAFDDAAPTLRAIAKRAPVHVLANWDMGLDGVLAQAGLRNLLGDVAPSELLGSEKPARECFEAFLARNGLHPTRVVYVGNEYVADVIGARGAGLIPVLLDRDNRWPAADCLRIRKLTDLAPLNEDALDR
jgi:putative hydrolase of the HAD superfamily